MRFFELGPEDITSLNDADLREMVGRLCEAELTRQGAQPSCVLWGGAQEAPDGGLDVIVQASDLNSASFVPRANTGFQVKKNSMSRAACTDEMVRAENIKDCIVDLATKKGAYIIVSGKDDCTKRMYAERLRGMEDAVKVLKNKDDLLLDFYGRDRLSSWLRQHPGVSLWVRFRLGKPLSGWSPFGRWAATPVSQNDGFLLDEHPCVIDTSSPGKKPVPVVDGIKLVRSFLKKPGSVVRLTGLSGVGKTRFAQALFEMSVGEEALSTNDVIYADLGSDLLPSASELTAYLIANDISAYIVLDNCPPDVHRELQKKMSLCSARFSLLTIEYDISDDRPEETRVIHLEPSSRQTVSALIQRRFTSLGRINADKIAEFSGGNARVAIALASRVDSDETLANFSDEDLFYRLFSQRKGQTEGLLEAAEILSLVYSFNISQTEYNNEISVLATVVGMDRHALNRSHAELLRRQLSQQRGNWRAVLPHALANRLARRALQNIPLSDINRELLKVENFRLLKSCAHRLGYLHDFEPAQRLAETWTQDGGPLNDISSWGEENLAILGYIAPLLTDIVLTAIERASATPNFASRENKNFSFFVRILRKLAYEDKDFDRAAGVILKFSESERAGENNNSIVRQLKSLFSLYLSGTQATPQRRKAFIDRLIRSNSPRHREIAKELLDSALQGWHWTADGDFDFGARKRDFGWEPKTYEERLEWYECFIELLVEGLRSNEEPKEIWAKEIIAKHFRGLWSFAGCFDLLEEIVRKYACDGGWPEIWMAIRKTISFDRETLPPSIFLRLETLERFSAPSDIYSEIEAYAFTSTWEHIEVRENGYSEEAVGAIHRRIEELGKLAAAEPQYIEKLAPRLWQKHIDALLLFGRGLAEGSADQEETFNLLVGLLRKQKQQNVEPAVFSGFVEGAYARSPALARRLQEKVLGVPELKPHFISLLCSTPVDSWGVGKLISVARSGEFEARQFRVVNYSRNHKAISDADLAELLRAINKLEAGVFSTLDILGMRFHLDKDGGYLPSEPLLSVGREAIKELLLIHRDESRNHGIHGLDQVVDKCLSVSTPSDDVNEIVKLLFDKIENFDLYSFDFERVIRPVMERFPELILENAFNNERSVDLMVELLFADRMREGEYSLNMVPIERILAWCNGDQGRINNAASAVSSYSPVDKKENPFDNPRKYILSEHIKALLDASNNKADIIEAIYSRMFPSSWSGSRAEIIDARAKAFAELLGHSAPEVRELAKAKMALIEQAISEERKWEAKRDTAREQRFE